VEAAEFYADGLLNDEEMAECWSLADGEFEETCERRGFDGEVVTRNAPPTVRAAYMAAAAAAEIASNAAEMVAAVIKKGEGRIGAALVRCIFGYPFTSGSGTGPWLRWNDGALAKIAEGIYTERAFDRMPILADALLDAGCDDEDILAHCREPGPHVRGCWVIDLVLGKQ
jgi:hypothetical protein